MNNLGALHLETRLTRYNTLICSYYWLIEPRVQLFVGMGVLPPTFSDVVIVLDSSAALSGVFPLLLKDYLYPLLE